MKYVIRCIGCGLKIEGINRQDALDIAAAREWESDFPTWWHVINHRPKHCCLECIAKCEATEAPPSPRQSSLAVQEKR